MQERENQYSAVRERERASSGCGTQDLYRLLAGCSLPHCPTGLVCLEAVFGLDLILF